jgi:hypothetical protein
LKFRSTWGSATRTKVMTNCSPTKLFTRQADSIIVVPYKLEAWKQTISISKSIQISSISITHQMTELIFQTIKHLEDNDKHEKWSSIKAIQIREVMYQTFHLNTGSIINSGHAWCLLISSCCCRICAIRTARSF